MSPTVLTGAEVGYGACTAALIELKVDLKSDDGVVREHSLDDLLGPALHRNAEDSVTLNRTVDGVTLTWASSASVQE